MRLQSKMNIEIREMTEADLNDVCRIEEAAFTMPWKREDFKDLIESDKSIYLVALCDGVVVGAAGYTDTVGEGYINNVVVDEKYRGRGIGKALVERVINDGEANGIFDYSLEVRVSNEPAVRMYKSLGFVSEGVRKRFYEKPVEDAYVMWRRH